MKKKVGVIHQLVQNVCLSIIESRKPMPTEQGHCLGSHFPNISDGQEQVVHNCSETNLECIAISEHKATIERLISADVPVCIEVWICPEGIKNTQDSILLECWIIQISHRIKTSSAVTSLSLFQAIKSYLYFSQLSSWLVKSQGKNPRSIEYRVTPGGDSVPNNLLHSHTFPRPFLPFSNVSVDVSSYCLPRSPEPLVSPSSSQYDDALSSFAGIKLSPAFNRKRYCCSSNCTDEISNEEEGHSRQTILISRANSSPPLRLISPPHLQGDCASCASSSATEADVQFVLGNDITKLSNRKKKKSKHRRISHVRDDSSTERDMVFDEEAIFQPIKKSDGSHQRCQSFSSSYFHSRTGLPIFSSPTPTRKTMSKSQSFHWKDSDSRSRTRSLSSSGPSSAGSSLLLNFEESVLNGRLHPVGSVDGFKADIGASGSFCPPHLQEHFTAYYFNVSDDNAPSPYLGCITLEQAGRRGYRIPPKGAVQLTLFNPSECVVKMFVVMYDLSDMPPSSHTFIRQRTFFMASSPDDAQPKHRNLASLRYLIHLRIQSSQSRKLYLHKDIRCIFSRYSPEDDANHSQFKLRSFTEMPHNPKYSPKK